MIYIIGVIGVLAFLGLARRIFINIATDELENSINRTTKK